MGPPFSFFSALRDFFPENFPKGSPLQFFCCFATEWMLENPKGSPLSVFFGTVRFFSENKNFPPSIFFMFCDKTPSTATKMLTISEVSLFQRARGSRYRAAARHSVHFFEYVIFSKYFFHKIFDFRVL